MAAEKSARASWDLMDFSCLRRRVVCGRRRHWQCGTTAGLLYCQWPMDMVLLAPHAFYCALNGLWEERICRGITKKKFPFAANSRNPRSYFVSHARQRSCFSTIASSSRRQLAASPAFHRFDALKGTDPHPRNQLDRLHIKKRELLILNLGIGTPSMKDKSWKNFTPKVAQKSANDPV